MKAKKSLGQNFISDEMLISQIVDVSGAGEDDYVLEIGPGRGALTYELSERVRKLTAVELDDDLIGPLKAIFAAKPNVGIVHDDILKYEIPNDVDIIIGNLPYYITTPIILGLFEKGVSARSMTFMVQKEVAERIVSAPGSKDYGVLSISVQYYADASYELDVPREYFKPQPKVDSAIVNLKVKDKRELSKDEEKGFFTLVKTAFIQRRKTLANALTGLCINNKTFNKEDIGKLLKSASIDPMRRPETLSISEFIELYRKAK